MQFGDIAIKTSADRFWHKADVYSTVGNGGSWRAATIYDDKAAARSCRNAAISEIPPPYWFERLVGLDKTRTLECK